LCHVEAKRTVVWFAGSRWEFGDVYQILIQQSTRAVGERSSLGWVFTFVSGYYDSWANNGWSFAGNTSE
jgi:hypothetical protein